MDQHLRIFQTFKPQEFKGAPDPIVVNDWLLKMEKFLNGMICPKNRRVALTTFVLKRGKDMVGAST